MCGKNITILKQHLKEVISFLLRLTFLYFGNDTLPPTVASRLPSQAAHLQKPSGNQRWTLQH